MTSVVELGLEFIETDLETGVNAFWVILNSAEDIPAEPAPQSVVPRTSTWTSGKPHEKTGWVSGPAQWYWIRTCSSKDAQVTQRHSNWTGTGSDCPLGEGISALLLWREIRGGLPHSECAENFNIGRVSQKDFWIRMFIEGTSLVMQWLRLDHAAQCRGTGFDPWSGV